MKLHIGCGNKYKKGFTNIDLYNKKADLIIPAHKLPFKNNSVDRIESYHLIEHLGYIMSVYALSEWYRVLKKEGKLILETPDIDRSFRKYLNYKGYSKKILMLMWIYGNELPGYYHKFCFSKEILKKLLVSIGFTDIKFGKQKTYAHNPGLRVVCKKSKKQDIIFDALANIRKKIFDNKLINFNSYAPMTLEDKFDVLKGNFSIKNIQHEFKKYPKTKNIILKENKKFTYAP